MTPTERAKWYLDGSVTNFRNAKLNNSISLIALGLEQMAQASTNSPPACGALSEDGADRERDAKIPSLR